MGVPRTPATRALAPLVLMACGPSALAAGQGALPEAEPVWIRADRAFRYRFVQQGLPAVMPAKGFGATDPERPGEAAARCADLDARGARGLAHAPERPRWRDGDFFGTRHGRPRAPAP